MTTPVDVKHKYAIVVGQRNELRADSKHPLLPRTKKAWAKSGKTYYELAQIACALAASIRQMGYSAKAHHVRNEQLFQVPHAVDAGLGEQGTP